MSTPDEQSPEVAALQAALAAEHAAIYGYGVVGGRVDAADRDEVREVLAAHRARRDALRRAVRERGGTPVAAAAGYALPDAVTDATAALELAGTLEEDLTTRYADLVGASVGAVRREAAQALAEAAVRVARWRGAVSAFPGLPEHAAEPAGGTEP